MTEGDTPNTKIHRPRRWLWLSAFCFLLAGCRGGETPPAPSAVVAPPLGPRVSVAAHTLDAGAADTLRQYERSFAIGNSGDAPLHLTLTRRSCSCGMIDAPSAILPGQTGKIAFRWTPPPAATGPNTLAAEFATDDPTTPLLRLELKYDAQPRVRIAPRDLAFLDLGRPIHAGTPTQRSLTVWSPALAAFALAASVSNPGLEVTTESLPASAEVEGGQARSGYRVLVRTTERLMPGYLRDDLVLTVTPPGEEARRLVLPVYAMMDNVAFRVAPEEIAFEKPRVTEADSKTVRVQFTVPAASNVLAVVRVEPAFLQATSPVRRGRGLWEFRVVLPVDHPDARILQPDHFFEGRVVLKVSTTPAEVSVRVKWVPPAQAVPPGRSREAGSDPSGETK